jgi:hypothetical protein
MKSGAQRLTATVLVAVATFVLAEGAAGAVSLTNRDDKDHKLTVIEEAGAKTTEHTLKPTQVLEGICPKGCIVRLNDSEEDEYELEPGDKVSIEEGYLYYDEPETGQTGAGGAKAPGSGSGAPAAAPTSPAAPATPAPEAPKKQ